MNEGAMMKLHVFLAICSQNKAALLSAAVLVSSVVGGGFYASTPGGQSVIQQIVQPVTWTTAQATSVESTVSVTQPTSTAPAQVVISKETTPFTTLALNTETAVQTKVQTKIQETTPAEQKTVQTTQETTQAAALETTGTYVEEKVKATKPKATATTAAATTTAVADTSAVSAAAAADSESPVLGDKSGTYDEDAARAVLDMVNQQRAAAGVAALTWDDTLAASAKIRATEIVVKWSHTRPDGSAWYTSGAQTEMGENLAYGQTSTQQVMNEWMASQGHANNILRSTFTQMGVSCYICNGTYYWVQHFA
jgi:uncharacterized protein YkwD